MIIKSNFKTLKMLNKYICYISKLRVNEHFYMKALHLSKLLVYIFIYYLVHIWCLQCKGTTVEVSCNNDTLFLDFELRFQDLWYVVLAKDRNFHLYIKKIHKYISINCLLYINVLTIYQCVVVYTKYAFKLDLYFLRLHYHHPLRWHILSHLSALLGHHCSNLSKYFSIYIQHIKSLNLIRH